jgi:hypothetical protein
METIGYKVNGALGYEVFLNENGAITIKQECPIAGEQLVVLNSAEAEILAREDLCKKAPQYFDSLQLTYRPTPSEEKLAKFRRAYAD